MIRTRFYPLWKPGLLDLKDAAKYLGNISPGTLREWTAAGIIRPIPLPGSAIREKGSNKVVLKPTDRKMRKLVFSTRSLDRLIEEFEKEA
ncbi:MAG: helix-turn-helix domain-containing protein [Acidobacteria bacterium]|nr:helix-turn-helix domain-containing protein [Acidobacteriota bacterium]